MNCDFKKFLEAQKDSYAVALSEIRAGQKTSHWIWYIFPQLKILGFSSTAQYYGIADLKEARAYLENKMLRKNLLEISQALLDLPECDIQKVMGYPDNLKLRSCMTLFQLADPSCEIFQKVLDKYFEGAGDEKTIAFCKNNFEVKNG